MDIDELLSAVNARHGAGGNYRSLKTTIEAIVRRRLASADVSVCDADPSAPVGEIHLEGTAIRVPIPPRPGARALQVVVRTPPGTELRAAERKFLERVASVYALAARAEPTPPSAPGEDGHVRDGAAPLIGHSASMQTLRERITRVASTDFTVLIEGESGSGKELVARQVHELSRRRRGPFVAVNCAAIVETLLEAELFGIEDRTATGVRGRRGKFELASGGTLFLDEVADLSPPAQAKLLRAIQDLAVERVGGSQAQRVDIRVIVATNKGLRSLVERGLFREDLYYRLSGVELFVPPLRTRREDVPELARYFLHRHRALHPLELTPAAADALASYDWPGNVRELERLVESALTMVRGDVLDVRDLPTAMHASDTQMMQAAVQSRESLRSWNRRYVSLVYLRCGENKREACRILDISYHTLQAYLRPASGRPPRRARTSMVHEHEPFGRAPAPARVAEA